VPNWPAHVTGDEMVAAMDKVGVDGAIFISAFSMYRYDGSYAVEVQRAHPGRFGIVKPVDPDDPAVADVVAEWKKTPGAVGVPIMRPRQPDRGRAPTRRGPGGRARAAAELHRRHNFLWGETRQGGRVGLPPPPPPLFTTDHRAPLRPRPPRPPPQPWADLPKV